MIVSYSRNASFVEAVSKTFDGDHPCSLCKLVRQGKASEKRKEAQKPEPKLDKLLPVSRPFILRPPKLPPLIFGGLDQLVSRVETPPKPPPRSLPA